MTRWLGNLWAFPVTLLGLPLRGTVLWALDNGEELYLANGLGRAFFRFNGMAAVTLGTSIIFRGKTDLSPRLLAHERRHVWQCRVFGPLMFVLWPLGTLVSICRGGGWYHLNPIEIDARNHE